MRTKTLLKYAVTLLLALSTLCGCSIMSGDVSALMKAPRPNEMQSELSKTVETTIGSAVKYTSPLSGNNKRSFILTDLDGDKKDEAIVFYLAESDSGTLASFAVYAMENSMEWALIKQVTGTGKQIDYIDLRDFNEDGKKDMLIGWIQSDTRKELCAYDIFAQPKDPIFSDIYQESRLFYDGYYFLIFNIYKDPAGTSIAKMSTLVNGTLRIISQCEIHGNYDTVKSVTYGKVQIDRKLILIDTVYGNNMITQFLKWDGNTLTNMYYTSEEGVPPTLIRETNYNCQDIDGDGLLEFPYNVSMHLLPLEPNVKDITNAAVTGWSSVRPGKDNVPLTEFLEREFYCIMDPARRFYYSVPPQWIGNIACTYNNIEQSYSVYHVQGEDYTKLFTLYELTQDQYNGRKDQGQWFELRKNGTRVYAVNIAEDLSTELYEFMGNVSQHRERLILLK